MNEQTAHTIAEQACHKAEIKAAFRANVARLAKDGNEIRATITPEKADLLHMAIGIAGEAGELADAVKKHVIYNQPLDRENVIEEMGDLEFFQEHLRVLLGLRRSEILAVNTAKLMARFPEGEYTDEAAQLRADKV